MGTFCSLGIYVQIKHVDIVPLESISYGNTDSES